MATYNFETRELVPFRSDWKRSNYGILYGALWYIKEKDGIYLVDKRSQLVDPHPVMEDFCLAKGLPAAIMAQGIELTHSDFDNNACYQAYFKMAKELFPEKPAYHIPTILEDWEYTLKQCRYINQNASDNIDNYTKMAVGVFLRDISNPYRSNNLEEIINHNYYYTCSLFSTGKPIFVFSQMPTVADRTEAPLIYASDINQPMSSAILQVDGFMAAIINLAIFYYWQKSWSEFNFTNITLIENINNAYRKQEPIIDVSSIHRLSFNLPFEVEDICRAYMAAFEPIMRKVWKMRPEVQFECIEGDNIYTYIYAHEASSVDRLRESELSANLSDTQKYTLISYDNRFMEWLVKNYPITMASQHRVMQAMAKDMPPIQLTIKNNIKVTHANESEREEDEPRIIRTKHVTGEPTKEEVFKQSKSRTIKRGAKFVYIISEDRKEINKIHKCIELHLSSPAKLRDELIRLDSAGAISLPMDKPTDIIRAVRDVWGDAAPKERSFVTTWGRRV